MHLSPGGRSRTLRAGRRYHGPLPSIGDEPGSRSSASSTHWPHETGWHECPARASLRGPSPFHKTPTRSRTPQQTGCNLADGLARRLSLDRLVKQEMRFIEGDAGGSLLEGARRPPSLLPPNPGETELDGSMISVQPREEEARLLGSCCWL